MLNEVYKSALNFRYKYEGVQSFEFSVFIFFSSLFLNIIFASFYFSVGIEKITITTSFIILLSIPFTSLILSFLKIITFLYSKKKAFKNFLKKYHLNEECSICLNDLTEVVLSSKNYNSQIFNYTFNSFKLNSKFSGSNLSVKEIFFSYYALEYLFFLDNLIQKAEEHQKIIQQSINPIFAS